MLKTVKVFGKLFVLISLTRHPNQPKPCETLLYGSLDNSQLARNLALGKVYFLIFLARLDVC